MKKQEIFSTTTDTKFLMALTGGSNYYSDPTGHVSGETLSSILTAIASTHRIIQVVETSRRIDRTLPDLCQYIIVTEPYV